VAAEVFHHGPLPATAMRTEDGNAKDGKASSDVDCLTYFEMEDPEFIETYPFRQFE
jgi:hypothetical protein